MELTNADLQKSLVALIDETLNELEELKKSKFAADEIKIEGPGEKDLAGKPVNGKLDAEKADKEEKEEKEEDEKEEKKVEKKEEKEEDKEEEKEEKKEMEKGVLDEAEEKKVVKKEEKEEKEEKKEDKKEEKEEKKEFPFKKSLEDQEALLKSYVDSKISGFESKLTQLTDMVAKLADQPVERKGIAAGQFAPLKKSEDTRILSKSDVASKLFELKKSGKLVETSDIVKAETGSSEDLRTIVDKYEIK